MSNLPREFRTPNSEFRTPAPCYACLYQPTKDSANSASSAANVVVNPLVALAQEFSPRYERHRDDLVSIDVSGLERLLGAPRIIGQELRREASARGMCVHVAIAAKRMAALVLAQARPGLSVVDAGEEAEALASVPIGILEKIYDDPPQNTQSSQTPRDQKVSASSAISAVKRWGLKTLGELAALPPAEVSARLGQNGLRWLAIARGDDLRPLVPAGPEERFESSLELDWPIDGLEPLSFVLTRLLEPLSIRLERRDRGAAVLHVMLRLVTDEVHDRRLDLPSPMRDVRALRTLILLDLESHPPGAAIDCVAIRIDPTPGRVLQHTLFTRALPTPDQLSTLLARLNALMGQDRIGTPITVDSHRPGAFEMKPFATDHDHDAHRDHDDRPHHDDHRRGRRDRRGIYRKNSAGSASSAVDVASALRRCRQPVPARVRIEAGRLLHVTTDRRGFAGGAVLHAAGPWITSGHWWAGEAGGAGRAGTAGREIPLQPLPPFQPLLPSWNREEWDVALSDGAVYRIFRDHTDGWFIDAIVD